MRVFLDLVQTRHELLDVIVLRPKEGAAKIFPLPSTTAEDIYHGIEDAVTQILPVLSNCYPSNCGEGRPRCIAFIEVGAIRVEAVRQNVLRKVLDPQNFKIVGPDARHRIVSQQPLRIAIHRPYDETAVVPYVPPAAKQNRKRKATATA
jgi:hypothetical protein